MKHLLKMFLGALLLSSCQDHELSNGNQSLLSPVQQKETSTSLLVFSSKTELQETLANMKNGVQFTPTRACLIQDSKDKAIDYGETVDYNLEKVDFVSLLESNKNEYMSKLTPAEVEIINNDEDELEYCMADSIIADYEFAQLLNKEREIQVNDTVYKYYGNGVAFTDSKNLGNLRKADNEISKIPVNDETIGKTLDLNNNVKFVPNKLTEVKLTEEIETRATSTAEPLTLRNGITIPACDIRDVDYKSGGDGGWLHQLWSGIWGKNVLAIKNFNNSKRLRLGFYDQNYIIYSNIGTTVKMQKKVLGIWWNCKADEIRVGWTAIELKYTFPSPVITYFDPNIKANINTNQSQGINLSWPSWFKNNFPFKNESSTLFYVPFTNYNVKIKDVNTLLKDGIKTLLKTGTNELKNAINSTKESQRGLYSADKAALYVITGADEYGNSKKTTFDKTFYAKWFPGTYQIGISYNGSFKVNDVKMDGGNTTQLSSGTVYGAVKYKGKWLAARITKSKDNE